MTNPIHQSILAQLLSADQKPRSRAEWEARFSHWSKPASETEETKIDAAKRRVMRALNGSTFLVGKAWDIVPQGSYHNNTNVRTESDVDLCVRLTNTYFFDGPPDDPVSMAELGFIPLTFTFDDYRNALVASLANTYGWSAVDLGKKAIHLHKDDEERVSLDVVPTFTYQLFPGRTNALFPRPKPNVGVAFDTTHGRRITNFPEQHYANGVAKNTRTGRRYKSVVRIVKRLRNHMAANPTAVAASSVAERAPSFLIESLIYNCPDDVFGNPSIYDDVVSALRYLALALVEPRRSLLSILDRDAWFEVNGIKRLFRSDQAWTETDAANFVIAALAYMEA